METKSKAGDTMKKPRKPRSKAKTATKPSQTSETPEEVERRHARDLLQPEAQASILVGMAYKDAKIEGQPLFDVVAIRDELKFISEEMMRGDMSHPERTAMAQIKSLDWLFSLLAAQAFTNVQKPNFESLMRLAFRAQSQCARTMETLAALKNPAIFTKQLNVANQQIVNNGAVPPAQTPNPPAALPESTPIVRLADSEIFPHAHERLD